MCENCQYKDQLTTLENRIATLERIEENRVRFGTVHNASPLVGNGSGWDSK